MLDVGRPDRIIWPCSTAWEVLDLGKRSGSITENEAIKGDSTSFNSDLRPATPPNF
jgi:hypothetical protein